MQKLSSFIKGQYVKKPILRRIVFFVIVVIIIGAPIVTYRIGFEKGADELSSRKFFSIFKNIDTDAVPLSSVGSDPGQTVDFSAFWKTWKIMDDNFTPVSPTSRDNVTIKNRVTGAISGLVGTYNDPYTVFIPKQQATAFKEVVDGEFQGIGAVMNQNRGVISVATTLKGSPAENAGLKVGDIILKVDGESVLGVPLQDVISKIRGPKDSKVNLTIKRGLSPDSDIAITRGVIVIPTTASRVITRAETAVKDTAVSVMSAVKDFGATVGDSIKNIFGSNSASVTEKKPVPTNDYYLLQLSTFSKSSTDAFVDELKKFAKSDSKALIIDLRNNPGGYIDVAKEIASHFLPKGAVVVREKIGKNSEEVVHYSEGYGTVDSKNKKIVVLVNGNSASASEILAGALKDNGVATIIGEKTFGKGSVQNLVDIDDIGSLKITIARWFTPNGLTISGTGLMPDIQVNSSDPKYASSTDIYIDTAIDFIDKK